MPELRRLLLIWLLFHSGAPVAQRPPAEVAGWQPVATTESGRIYRRAVSGSSVPAIMIATRFEAAPARVRGLVTDYDSFAEFVPYVRESRVLAREGDRQWVLHRLRFPGPLAERAYVFESNDSVQEAVHRVDWQLSERQFEGIDLAGAVRPRRFSGFWELRPEAGGTATRARYAVHSDPGGLLPPWLVSRVTERYVQQVVEAMRGRLSGKGP